MTNPLKSFTFWLMVIIICLVGFLIYNSFQKKQDIICSEKNIDTFIKSNFAPSSYFGGELKTRKESESGNILIRKDILSNRDILTIYFKRGEVIELWEEGSSRSMNPTISDDTITINLLTFNESDLHIGDMVNILNEINSDGTKNLNKGMLHRIVDIKKENGKTYFLTKGDNNQETDIWWEFSDIYSKIIGVLY